MEEKLRRIEANFVRKTYSPRRAVEGGYRRLMNPEVQERLQKEDIVKAVDIQKLRWCSNIRRMGEEKVVKIVTELKPDFKGARGSPKSRWEKQLLEDIKRLRIRNSSGKIQDRKSWKETTKVARTSKALE